MFYSDFSPRDVCRIQCINAQNKNFKLFLVRVPTPLRGEKTKHGKKQNIRRADARAEARAVGMDEIIQNACFV